MSQVDRRWKELIFMSLSTFLSPRIVSQTTEWTFWVRRMFLTSFENSHSTVNCKWLFWFAGLLSIHQTGHRTTFITVLQRVRQATFCSLVWSAQKCTQNNSYRYSSPTCTNLLSMTLKHPHSTSPHKSHTLSSSVLLHCLDRQKMTFCLGRSALISLGYGTGTG